MFLQVNHQKVIKNKNRERAIKVMHKYAQLKRFHNNCQLQAYMNDFMYVDTKTMSVEDYFPYTFFVYNYNKMSTPGPVPKHWIIFSYIRSEYYELDPNFDETELEKNQTIGPTIKLNYFVKVLWC